MYSRDPACCWGNFDRGCTAVQCVEVHPTFEKSVSDDEVLLELVVVCIPVFEYIGDILIYYIQL